eukprot:evm.model.NODE_10334_length_8003_cov_14.519180.1
MSIRKTRRRRRNRRSIPKASTTAAGRGKESVVVGVLRETTTHIRLDLVVGGRVAHNAFDALQALAYVVVVIIGGGGRGWERVVFVDVVAALLLLLVLLLLVSEGGADDPGHSIGHLPRNQRPRRIHACLNGAATRRGSKDRGIVVAVAVVAAAATAATAVQDDSAAARAVLLGVGAGLCGLRLPACLARQSDRD